MKIHQLPNGARFRFQGEEYVKTGPMMGTGKQGQKMFPRYLDLEALDPPPEQAKRTGPLTRDAVLRAFETFRGECRDVLAADQVEIFERACERFRAALDT